MHVTAPGAFVGVAPAVSDEVLLARIADYERISAILWLILGIIQVLMIITIIAGIWNIYAATTRFAMSPRIRARDPGVPAAYEGNLVQLVILGALNFFLGAGFGVLFVIFDFYIRDTVLKNRRLFDSVAAPELSVTPAADSPTIPANS